LQGKKETDNGADQEEGTQQVNLSDLFLESHVRVSSFWVGEKEEHCDKSDSTEGKVYPEALAIR